MPKRWMQGSPVQLESFDELETLQRVANARRTVACAAVRINPDVDARTHQKISTGKSDNKFGVGIDEARSWFSGSKAFPNVRLDGLHVHIGSQILDLEPFRQHWRGSRASAELVAADTKSPASTSAEGWVVVISRRTTTKQSHPSSHVRVIREALTGFEGRILRNPCVTWWPRQALLLTR